MKSRKFLRLIFIWLFFSKLVLAQHPPDFFPHHLGDLWEYFVINGVGNDTLQVKVIFDSTDQNGNSYIIHHRQFINPVEPPYFNWYENYFVDTSAQVFAEFSDSEILIYKLNATLKKLWIVQDFGAGYHIARLEKIYPDTLFGIPTISKAITYYATEDTSDTTIWLPLHGEILSDGFGVIQRGGAELGYIMFLKGAIIDGEVYGDTTVVSLQNYFSPGTIPEQAQLFQNYPNPFNPITIIQYNLPVPANIELIVYDLLGRKIGTLVNTKQTAGNYRVEFDGSSLSSGIYLYRLKINNEAVFAKKMVLLK